MNLESQVASLELSKKLRDLGVVQESRYYYAQPFGETHIYSPEAVISWGMQEDFYGYMKDIRRNHKGNLPPDIFAAFTVAELGVALPECIVNNGHLEIKKHITAKTHLDCWAVRYEFLKQSFLFKSLADSMAEMLVYLLENKIITVEEVNGRLAA